MLPVVVHFGQYISFEFATEAEKKLRPRRNGIALKILLIFNVDELEEFLHFTKLFSCFEPPLTRLVDFSSWHNTINCYEEQLPRVDFVD
jgi:hypothetical protein